MRDTKSSLLLVVSFLLLSVSLVFLSIWGYQFINRNQKENSTLNKGVQSTTVNDGSTHDSMIKIYTSTIKNLDARIDSVKVSTDSLIGNVDNQLNEINTIRDEVNAFLKIKNSKNTFTTESEKIQELQSKVVQLQNQNINFEKENKQLKAALQYTDQDKAVKSQHINSLSSATKPPVIKTTPTQTFVVKDILIMALQVKDNKELETFKAAETKKLSGSFIIKSSITRKNVNIFIAVLRPNGKAGQNSAWDA
jgi:predicted RNase H-like nuclease (RuvC/YqgF family)